MSLDKKFESSLSWQSINVVMQVILQLIFIAFMTRLLDRKDFGVLSIALVVVGFIEIFSQIGIGPALIQRKDLSKNQINGAFHISLILGVSFFILLFFISPSIAQFYGYEPLSGILRVIGFSFIISALSIVPKSLIIKKMQFKKLFVAAMAAMIIGNFGVGLTLAYLDYKIWAYVFALLAQNTVMSIFYWVQNPIKIERNWSFQETRSMLKYGIGSTLFNLFNYAASKIDVVLVGKYGSHMNNASAELSTTPMSEEMDVINRWTETGVYDRSVYLNSLPITVLGKLSDSVLFSGLSSIQDQIEKLKKTFLSGTYFISMLVIPSSIFLIFFSEELVLSFYSEKYIDVVPIVKVLFISIGLRSLIKLSDAVVRALDAVYQASIIKLIFFLCIGLGTFFMLDYGLTAVAWVIVFSVFIQYVLMTLLSMKLIEVKASQILKKMVPGIVLGIIVAVISIPFSLLNNFLDFSCFIELAIALVANFALLSIVAWKMPWLFGKGQDNILIFVLNKLPNWSFLEKIKSKLKL